MNLRSLVPIATVALLACKPPAVAHSGLEDTAPPPSGGIIAATTAPRPSTRGSWSWTKVEAPWTRP